MWRRVRDVAGWLARESTGLLVKEVLKYVLYGVAVFLGTFLLSTIGTVFESPPASWTEVWQRIWDATKAFVASPLDFAVRSLFDDPLRSLATALLASGYIVLFVLLRRARRGSREAAAKQALASQAGLGGRWPHAHTNNPDGAPWHDLCSEIARLDNHVLYILGANGVDTFGDPGSPLFAAMQAFRGTVRAILIDPNSNEMDGRAAAVGMNPADYRRAIRTSERRLRELRRQQHAVEGRFYNGQPNWKFIITSTTAWVQYYIPGGRHVNETAVWRFDASQDGDSLYHVFRMEFERIWRRCERKEMNLA